MVVFVPMVVSVVVTVFVQGLQVFVQGLQVVVPVVVESVLSLQHEQQEVDVEHSEQDSDLEPGQKLQVFYHNCNPSYNERRK